MIDETCELCDKPSYQPRAGYALCQEHCAAVDRQYQEIVSRPVPVILMFQLHESLIFGEVEAARAAYQAFVYQESAR